MVEENWREPANARSERTEVVEEEDALALARAEAESKAKVDALAFWSSRNSDEQQAMLAAKGLDPSAAGSHHTARAS